jgi:hypothetical protein
VSKEDQAEGLQWLHLGCRPEDGKWENCHGQRMSEFVKAHDLKVGYFLVFKKLDTRSLKMLVFYHNYCEIRIRCAGYHPSLTIGL